MFRFFATKPRIPRRLVFDSNGEFLVLKWSGMSNYLKYLSIIWPGYIYFLYHLDPLSMLGSFSQYTVPGFTFLYMFSLMRFRKFLHKLVLIEGGQLVKIETYPMTGWGHYTKRVIPVQDFDGIIPYGLPRWYNPYRWGRGFYRLRYESNILWFKSRSYVIFRIQSDYDKEVLKLISIGKEVTDSNLSQLSKFTSNS
jgi:hypothetical protein